MAVEVGNWEWEVVVDPTRQGEHPGDFFGGRFRFCDLRFSAENKSWPEGIVFRHIKSGKDLRYQREKLQPVGTRGSER